MEGHTILVVEDDDGIRGLIRLSLGMEGYQVIESTDGLDAEKKINAGGFDLVLLDIMLPGKDGYALLPEFQKADVPVIFLTAKSSLSDRVLGLKSGVEDYITKPFEPLELLARVQLVLKRQEKQQKDLAQKSPGAQDQVLSYGDILISETGHTVTYRGDCVDLTEKEYELLHFLVMHQGQAFTREQILDDVWGYDYAGGTRTVDVHVSSLRGKLGLGKDLETVYKLDYRMKKRGQS